MVPDEKPQGQGIADKSQEEIQEVEGGKEDVLQPRLLATLIHSGQGGVCHQTWGGHFKAIHASAKTEPERSLEGTSEQVLVEGYPVWEPRRERSVASSTCQPQPWEPCCFRLSVAWRTVGVSYPSGSQAF